MIQLQSAQMLLHMLVPNYLLVAAAVAVQTQNLNCKCNAFFHLAVHVIMCNTRLIFPDSLFTGIRWAAVTCTILHGRTAESVEVGKDTVDKRLRQAKKWSHYVVRGSHSGG